MSQPNQQSATQFRAVSREGYSAGPHNGRREGFSQTTSPKELAIQFQSIGINQLGPMQSPKTDEQVQKSRDLASARSLFGKGKKAMRTMRVEHQSFSGGPQTVKNEGFSAGGYFDAIFNWQKSKTNNQQDAK